MGDSKSWGYEHVAGSKPTKTVPSYVKSQKARHLASKVYENAVKVYQSTPMEDWHKIKSIKVADEINID